jgi:hypothetical protein
VPRTSAGVSVGPSKAVVPVTSPSKAVVQVPTGKTGGVTALAKPAKPPVTGADFNNEILTRMFALLDERSLGLVGLVCKKWRAVGLPLLEKFVPAMMGHGSATGQLKGQIVKYLAGAKTLEMAVDQFPCPPQSDKNSILNYILTKGIALDLALGTNDKNTRQRLLRAGQTYTHVTTGHKMHNKIWVIDKEGVIVGSPNVSFSGLEGRNLESFILIKSPRVGKIFRKYLELVRSPEPGKSPLWGEVSNALTKYNSEQHQLKLAFAPVMKITDFVAENLKDGVTKIVVRQFLISPAEKRAESVDILGVLCGMAKAKVDVEVYLDDGAWEHFPFVQRAASTLVEAGCKVFTQTPVMVVNGGNEAIQHDKLILATLHNGVCRTLIGSAGFTRDVIANNNWENFICTDVKSVHDSLMAHHLRTLDAGVAKTFTITA